MPRPGRLICLNDLRDTCTCKRVTYVKEANHTGSNEIIVFLVARVTAIEKEQHKLGMSALFSARNPEVVRNVNSVRRKLDIGAEYLFLDSLTQPSR